MAHDDERERDDWKRDLTPEQVATVERAAKAAWERGGGDIWHLESAGVRDHACADQLAALRASEHPAFPEPPKMTRGEEVAKERICVYGFSDPGGPFIKVYGKPDVCVRAVDGDTIKTGEKLRKNYAAAIDAERAAARVDGINEAAAWLAGEIDESHRLVNAIRALAAKAAQPRELREQDGAERDGAGRGGG